MSESETTKQTTGTTLEGEELDPENDPYEPQTEDDHHEESSIYPIETEFKVEASFTDSGRHPFHIGISILIPIGVDSIPSSRTKAVRKDLQKTLDLENPKLGTRGKITFTERDHTIKLYSEDERNTKTVGEWVFEQFFYMLNETNAKDFSDADIPIEDVTTIQDAIHTNLPGKFITVEGTCSKCDNKIKEEVYTREDLDKGFVMCECGVGTTYDQK